MNKNNYCSRKFDSKCQLHVSLCAKETLSDIVDKILKNNLKKIKISATAVRIASNAEVIHDMRVAIRRLRAALEVFKKVFSTKTKPIQKELHKLGKVLGKKRDFDVFSEFVLKVVSVKSNSLQKFARQKERLQQHILAMLSSNDYIHLMESLEQIQTIATKHPLFRVSKDQICKELDRVLEIGSAVNIDIDDKTLHKLRISAKKLRYVCEFVEPLLRKKRCSIGSLIAKAKMVQDILGDHQDAIKGISMLIRYKSKFSPREFLQIKKKYELKKMRARRLFMKTWKLHWDSCSPINPMGLCCTICHRD